MEAAYTEKWKRITDDKWRQGEVERITEDDKWRLPIGRSGKG